MLTGISGPDAGIDELALTFAKKNNNTQFRFHVKII